MNIQLHFTALLKPSPMIKWTRIISIQLSQRFVIQIKSQLAMEIAFKSFEEKIIHYTLTRLNKKLDLLDHLMSQNQDYSVVLKNLGSILKHLIV